MSEEPQPIAARPVPAADPSSSSTLIASGGANSPKYGARPSSDLAPLEYLQQHRRGSITDPSLHAASPNANLGHSNTTLSAPSRSGTPSSKSTPAHEQNGVTPQDSRPAPSYVFGDATPRPGNTGSPSSSSPFPVSYHQPGF